MKTIRWGIIGCGDVCEVKSGPAFYKVEGSELSVVMRRNGDKAKDFAERHGVRKWTDDAEAVIGDAEVDAVYVATPVGSHRDYALRVAEAGKACYVEKPMARSGGECRAMVEAFEKRGLKLYVGYYRRRLPRFVKVRDLVESGRLGKVTSAGYQWVSPSHRGLKRGDLPWRLDAEQSGGGLFMDLGSHTLDVLDYILGPIEEVGGVAVNRASEQDVEDNVVMHMRWASGVVGSAGWNFAGQGAVDRIEIWGTEGCVRLTTFGNEPVELITGSGVEKFDLPNPKHVHQPLVQTIVDELKGKGECPSTGRSAMRTAWVMDEVLKGYYGGRDEGYWEKRERWGK